MLMTFLSILLPVGKYHVILYKRAMMSHWAS